MCILTTKAGILVQGNQLTLVHSLRWYNATYALFAVTILLTIVFHQLARTRQGLEDIFNHIDRAILVLQAMDECLVARNAACIIKRTLARARRVPQPNLNALPLLPSHATDLNEGFVRPDDDLEQQTGSGNQVGLLQPPHVDDQLGEIGEDLEWLNVDHFNDGQQALFWTEWVHELGTLGT